MGNPILEQPIHSLPFSIPFLSDGVDLPDSETRFAEIW